MCNTKDYDRPIGQTPETSPKLGNNRIKDHRLHNLRKTKIVQLIYKTIHHRRRSHTPQPPAIQNNKNASTAIKPIRITDPLQKAAPKEEETRQQ
jgi:hypothetical protein